MGIGIYEKHMPDIQKHVNESAARFVQAAISHFKAIGNEFVATRAQGYNNDTGALTGSVGFLVTVNGRQVHQGGFETGHVKTGQIDKSRFGQAKGVSLANKVKPNKGIALTVVAGERYAAAVEAKGRTVITTSCQSMGNELKALISSI